MSSTSTSPLRYTSAELSEFEALIRSKLATAQEEFDSAKDSLQRFSSNSTDDTYMGSSTLEDGHDLMEREDLMRTAVRQGKFIAELTEALARIRRGDYGICRISGALIPKERLRLVPHATMSIVAKEGQGARP